MYRKACQATARKLGENQNWKTEGQRVSLQRSAIRNAESMGVQLSRRIRTWNLRNNFPEKPFFKASPSSLGRLVAKCVPWSCADLHSWRGWRNCTLARREWSIIDFSPFKAMVKNRLLICSLRTPSLSIVFHRFKWQIYRYIAKHATPLKLHCATSNNTLASSYCHWKTYRFLSYSSKLDALVYKETICTGSSGKGTYLGFTLKESSLYFKVAKSTEPFQFFQKQCVF